MPCAAANPFGNSVPDAVPRCLVRKGFLMSDGTLNLTVLAARKASGTSPASARRSRPTTRSAGWRRHAAPRWRCSARAGADSPAACSPRPALALTLRAAMGRRDFGVARDFIDRQLKDNGWRAPTWSPKHPTSRSRRATRHRGLRRAGPRSPSDSKREAMTMSYMELEFPGDAARRACARRAQHQ